VKQLTVISGKGGTGKTSLTAAFATLSKGVVLADCDVDAADLHLILRPEVIDTEDFIGLPVAEMDKDKCTSCGECLRRCRFGAISEDLEIVPEKCEGCGVCALVCPVSAIEMVDRVAGKAYVSETRAGPMAHAKLLPGQEATGKLVARVRDMAKQLAELHKRRAVIIDGPPGIGCPVIAAISGVDLVLVVTEPTLSGIHDLERVLGVAEHFKVPAAVCINKWDINPENAAVIEAKCADLGVEVLGRLPYDDVVTRAMLDGKSVTEFSDGPFAKEVAKLWELVWARLMGEEDRFDVAVERLQREMDDEAREAYSELAIREANDPQNVGRMEHPDGFASVDGWCGDNMEMYFKVSEGKLSNVTFWTDGCGSTIACGSRLTAMAVGMEVEEALGLTAKQLIDSLGGLPQENRHCAALAVGTLKKALRHYLSGESGAGR